MKTCVIGGGAIGSLLAARLSRSGADVVLLVHRDKPPIHQIELIDGHNDCVVPVRVECEPTRLGKQDLIIFAVKAHAIESALPSAAALSNPNTIILTAVNGVPWWFCEAQQSASPLPRLASVDRNGKIADALKAHQLVGCVLFPAAHMTAPGIVRHLSGNRIVFGNPRSCDNAATRVADLFTVAGFETPVAPDIRAALWAKLVGNAAVNPLSVITGMTIQLMAEHPNLSAVLTRAMAEIDAVGKSIGIAPMMTQADRLRLAASVGHHKTSMLQDFEAGRPLELSPLSGAVREIAQVKGIATPVLDIFDDLVAARLTQVGSC